MEVITSRVFKYQKKPSILVFQIPVLQDNYIYILRDFDTKKTAVVDPALEEPVNCFLQKHNWKLDFILNTHHHEDHIGGNLGLKKKWKCKVVGFALDSHRIPGIDQCVQKGDLFYLGKSACQILFFPGHTLGHISYWFFNQKKLFIGDTLFAMGCGRLFEGTPRQMFLSLNQIKSFDPQTEIFCAHEYTEKNARFALSVDHQNYDLQKRMERVLCCRQKQQFTVPFLLSEELKTNPFLRASTVEEFTHLRKLRDFF